MTWGRLVFISFCVWVWDRKCLSPLLSSSSSSRETSRADTGDSRPQPGTETLTLSGPLSTQQFPQSLSAHIQTAMLLSWGAWDRSGLGSYGASWQAVMANTHTYREIILYQYDDRWEKLYHYFSHYLVFPHLPPNPSTCSVLPYHPQ